jgi:hypothetical protein
MYSHSSFDIPYTNPSPLDVISHLSLNPVFQPNRKIDTRLVSSIKSLIYMGDGAHGVIDVFHSKTSSTGRPGIHTITYLSGMDKIEYMCLSLFQNDGLIVFSDLFDEIIRQFSPATYHHGMSRIEETYSMEGGWTLAITLKKREDDPPYSWFDLRVALYPVLN